MTAAVRQVEIEQHEVRRLRADEREAVVRRAGFLDRIARGGQEAAQQPADLFVVVDDEDPGGRGFGMRREGR
jgi:hypothetical protein